MLRSSRCSYRNDSESDRAAASSRPAGTCHTWVTEVEEEGRASGELKALEAGWSLRSRRMRLVVARCSVDYEGRLSAHLPLATRLIMVKADGCVAIHADGGAYKPLNWMNAPNHLSEEHGRWIVTNARGERLTIEIEEVLSDTHFDLGADPGLQKDGVEANLQELLAAKPDVLEEGLALLRREYPTDLGPVDILCTDRAGDTVAVEVKRRGEIEGVEQLTRYLERLNLDPRLAPVRGILAAQTVTVQARVLADARGIRCVEVDYQHLAGLETNELRLF